MSQHLLSRTAGNNTGLGYITKPLITPMKITSNIAVIAYFHVSFSYSSLSITNRVGVQYRCTGSIYFGPSPEERYEIISYSKLMVVSMYMHKHKIHFIYISLYAHNSLPTKVQVTDIGA